MEKKMPNMIMRIFKLMINRIIRKKAVIEKKKKRFKMARENKSNKNSKNKRLTIWRRPLYR
jgi:hypothetical protein